MTKRKIGNALGTNWRTEVYKFDDKKKAAYIARLRSGGRRHASARAVGVSPQTIINHRESDPDFRDACDLAEMESDDEIEDALRRSAIKGNVTAALAWLYSRQSDRWSDTRHLSGKIEVNDWHSEAIKAIRDGVLTPAMLRDGLRLTDDEISALYREAGIKQSIEGDG